MTGWRIRARRIWWWWLYHGHLALLAGLATTRYVCVGLALLAHRAHTAVAAHGHTVADTLGARHYPEATRPRPERYARLARALSKGEAHE